MDQQTTNFFTIAFSLYGAIVSTISFLVASVSVYIVWLAYKRDNPKITVKVENGFMAPPSVDEGAKIFIKVINDGRRPAVITNTGFRLNSGKDLITVQPRGVEFPYEIKEGNYCLTIYDRAEILKFTKTGEIYITHAWADDATGKRHKTEHRLQE